MFSLNRATSVGYKEENDEDFYVKKDEEPEEDEDAESMLSEIANEQSYF